MPPAPRPLALLLATAACMPAGSPPGLRVAVAGNFAAPFAELASRFEAETGVPVQPSFGSTGQLFAQIVNGAPFDLFLAADAERPRRLEREGLAVGGSRVTYAVGRLALYAPGADSIPDGGAGLLRCPFTYLAIANPTLAPYGRAARETLERWGAWSDVRDRIVTAGHVGQALQFVASGAAEIGFVAMSQLRDVPAGAYWTVPDSLHTPIRQDAVQVAQSPHPAAARAFLAFLRSAAARDIVSAFGYDPTPP